MEASEAPERIYVCDNVFPSHVDWDGSPINTKRIDDHDIEYVRKDAFIEKAEMWLSEHWRKYINVDADGVVCFGHWKNDFRKAMKGE